MNFYEVIARRKLGKGQEWEAFRFEAIGSDLLVEGGIPRLLKSGPRKGRKTWREAKTSRVVISLSDIELEVAAYESETGNCSECLGAGQTAWSWSSDEIKYRACRRCNGTGKHAIKLFADREE